MPNKVSFVAVTAAAIALAAFVTLEYTFRDTFARSLSSGISDVLTPIWGHTVPFSINVAVVGIVYLTVAVGGGALGVWAYKVLRRILTFLAGKSCTHP